MWDLWRGNANAWECDELGHLNVRAYLAKAREALDLLFARAGQRLIKAPPSAIRVTAAHVHFLAEARPGDALTLRGGVSAIGDKTLTAFMLMRHGLSGKPAAAIVFECEHYATSDGAPFRWSSRLRNNLDSMMITAPPDYAPKGIDGEFPITSRARLVELSVPTISLGVLGPGEVALNGFASPATYYGRASDGFQHVLEPAKTQLAEARMNIAMVESQLRLLQPIQTGQPIEAKTGFARLNGKTAHVVHHFFDPVTEDVLAHFVAVGVFFDLQARRAKAPSAQISEALSANLFPFLDHNTSRADHASQTRSNL